MATENYTLVSVGVSGKRSPRLIRGTPKERLVCRAKVEPQIEKPVSNRDQQKGAYAVQADDWSINTSLDNSPSPSSSM
jgi:hypothetical protein